MKRKSLKLIACAAVMAMTLSVTACGGSDDAAPAAETEAEAEDTTEAEAEPEAEEAPEAEAETEDTAEAETETEAPEAEAESDDAAAGDTVESLLNDPATKAQYEEAFAEYEEQGMSVAVEAKGNELVMSLTFTDSSMVQDGMTEQLEAGLDATASTFETLAGSLDTAVGADAGTCTYSVRYLDADGNVLAERSFSAK
ncbi:MAG: DUF4854 domain-containing protein [Lachnospiraceae bacterium]